MEIRECLSVYLESGYLFDDMSGRLKWFKIDKDLDFEVDGYKNFVFI